MDWVLGVLVGISLSAACGFRVFVPMLVMSIAVHAGQLQPSVGFEWLGSWPALMGFAIATVVEIAAYFIPLVNHALDLIATPAAAVAGTVLTASMIGEISPALRWILAAIAGGAVAGGVQVATVTARGLVAPTGASGALSAAEDAAAFVASVLAVTVPIFAVLLLATGIVFLLKKQKNKSVV